VRPRIGIIVVLALVSCGALASAQPARKMARIGLLSVGTAPSAPLPPQWVAFIDGLRELGYIEGQNVQLERRFAGGKSERVAGYARELVESGVDVIVATGLRENRAALEATKTIPIVMLVVDDPVGDGLIASLAKPGGNITGLTFGTTGIGGKYVELLRQAAPVATRVAIVGSRPPATAVFIDMRAAARALNVTLLTPIIVKNADDLASVFRTFKRDGVGGVIFPSDALSVLHRQRIVELAAKNAVPAIYAQREHVEAGGLMAYGPSFPANFRRAATFVDKILKGARPADLPVEQPTKFELVLNMRAATALNLMFPPGLLARADEVIQ
jgi:putative tryptophan/tyrosine transport system substrate-binding protein